MSCMTASVSAVALGSAAHAALREGARGFPEPGATPQYAPSWRFRVQRAWLTLHLHPEAARVEGEVTYEVTAVAGRPLEVVLDCDGPEITRAVDGDGNALGVIQGDGTVRLTGLAPGATAARVTLSFRAERPTAGLYFTGPTPAAPHRPAMAWTQCQDEDAHFFFPCVDHPRAKHPWHITLTGPEGSTLLSNGALVREATEGGRAVAVYEMARPMPVYLFTAVCGPLVAAETAWEGRPVRYLVPADLADADLDLAFGRTPEMIQLFSERTGVPYPWPRYDQVVVHDFIFGGMENVACTTMIDVLLVDGRVGPHWPADHLVSHELAHQWFGDLVTCQDWGQAWLNESWATFMETVWWDHAHGGMEATWYAFSQARAYFEEDGGRYRRPIESYLYRSPIDLFDRHLYEKASVVLRTLRTELGAEAFWAGTHRYLTAHADGVVHGRHFQTAMEEATGVNLDRFFQQWIHGAGHPELKVSGAHADGLLTLTVAQTQTGEGVAEAFAFPLKLEIVDAAGVGTSVTLRVSERERTWAIPVAGEVRTVRVDPRFGVLCTVKLEFPTPWLLALVDDGCPVLAARAVHALARKNTPAAIAALRRALAGDGFHAVRAEIAEKLGQRGQPEDVAALRAALRRDDDPRVLVSVARALGAHRSEVAGDAFAADALIAAIEGWDSTWHLLGELLLSLGRTRDPRAAAVLRAHLGRASWADTVAGKALAGLAATQDPAVLPDLLAASRDPRDRVAAAAAGALGTLGDAVASVRVAARERLEALTREGGFRTVLAALGALGRLREPESAGVLSALHTSAPDGRTRRMAWEALAKVQEGRRGQSALAGLTDRLDALAAENRALRERLDKLDRPKP